ncbi:MAG: CBS domain-containing protein [Acidilobaceae archaeon]|nr:CBS domain-containing protein [Acidilobaceae archaeon]MCX8165284.1 CBS domain-containing protein [Acidilobaceae archaeon]MDW7973710.1 CBS domain-containing protein [Sulfolobales archaeon]
MLVSELLRREPVKVSPLHSIAEASRVMVENKVGSVLVVEGERLVGIFTERDLLRAVAAGAPLDSPVQAFMSRNLITVSPRDTVYRAIELMTTHNIRHLPVVEGDKLVGVISIRDVAEWIRRSMAERMAEAEMGHFVG